MKSQSFCCSFCHCSLHIHLQKQILYTHFYLTDMVNSHDMADVRTCQIIQLLHLFGGIIVVIVHKVSPAKSFKMFLGIIGTTVLTFSGYLMSICICPKCRLAHAESILHVISCYLLGDAVDVNGSTEELINMPFAVIVLASNTTHRYLITLGRGVEPRLLDLINGHHFLARIIVKHLILLFPFCWFQVLCWLFCFYLFTELALAGRNHTLVGITLKHLLYISLSNECHSAAQS